MSWEFVKLFGYQNQNVNPQVLADRPDAADQYAFSVEDGDVILLATDGIFDNVPDRLLVERSPPAMPVPSRSNTPPLPHVFSKPAT